MEPIVDVVEHFYGVYLLLCENPDYKGRTYIGYTVDPVRRLKRHNAGKEFGGAKRTSNKGPWNMILIIHGFPNSRTALRFEWAWQHPNISRQLRHVGKKKSNEPMLKYLVKIVSDILQAAPWCRLPLVVQWLDSKLAKEFSDVIVAPDHMLIKYGKVTAKKIGQRVKKSEKQLEVAEVEKELDSIICDICFEEVDKVEMINCVEKDCQLLAHMICLAKVFRKDKKILPIQGQCPECRKTILWGDMIRKKIGCQI